MPDEFIIAKDEFSSQTDWFGAPDQEEEELPEIEFDKETDPESQHAKAMDELMNRYAAADAAEKEQNRRRFVLSDSRFFVCVCFESADQMEEWVAKADLEKACDEDDPQFMDGIQLAARMGIELTPSGIEIKENRIEKRYLDMSDPLP